ncbi:unnamed protein product [Staurois parvus]|uniref:Transposase n=1 Tax=Staurois parvus TaxID=386267 RepID=A0ABN9BVE7_9NEOB|nr:unnamed protein product [Staurois parvus]
MAEYGMETANGRAVNGLTAMRRRYRGHGRLGAWQQLWEARNLPDTYVRHTF